MTGRLAFLAALGSALLLAGALAFQHLGGLAPCPLCLWQRWPHAIAAVLGLAVLLTGWRGLAGLGAALLLGSAGLGLFHAGVEQGWWEGLAECGGIPTEGLTPEEFLARLAAAPVARCDEIAWSFAGLSMAAWNGLLSLGLALLWARAARAPQASSSASQ